MSEIKLNSNLRPLITLFSLVWVVANVNAVTYYVDYGSGSDSNAGTSQAAPWKRVPGMTGFTGAYTHSSGDIFVFKGGVTWPSGVFPWYIVNSGNNGNIDTYTADPSWFSGVSWLQPTFDGGGTQPVGGMVQANRQSYISLDNLHFTNHGLPQTTGTSPNMINFLDCHHLLFSRLTLDSYSQRALYVHWDTPGLYSSFSFTSNNVSHCASMLWFAAGTASVTIDGFTMQANTLFDCSSQIGNGVHGDGFVHMFGTGGFTVTNIDFSRNFARGDFRRSFGTDGAMTAFFFVEGGTYSGKYYNNVFAPSPVQSSMFESFTTISGTGNTLGFYNNTFFNSGVNCASAGFLFNCSGGTIVVRNNIIQGLQYAVYAASTTPTYDFNWNLWNSTSGSLAYGPAPTLQNYATWQAAGRDLNSIFGVDPLFANPPTDLSLKVTSPIRDKASDLSAIFTTDKDGFVRVGLWDIGAYEYLRPAPPTNVRVAK